MTQSIRLNPFKPCDPADLPQGSPVPWSPYGIILPERPSFTMDPLYHAGCYYVQDSSAMFVGHIFRKVLGLLAGGGVNPSGTIRVLDLCAAPGGKTTDLAASLRQTFGDGFLLVSNEVMKARVGILAGNVAVWGDPNVVVTSCDPAVIGCTLPGFFDIIVADVPCSGEGMFRKDERAVEEWSPAVVDLCAARQKRILADVWPALREGGWLVYSTCTYEDAENDANLQWAAETLGGEILPPDDEFPRYGVRVTRHGNLLKAGDVPGEGQWAGALKRTAPDTKSTRCGTVADLHPLGYASRPEKQSSARQGGRSQKPEPPDPDLPLRIDSAGKYPVVDVDLHTALRYLHRDSLVLPGAPVGYVAVAYKGHPLGFVKNIGSRCNNLLPQARRILKDI